MGVTIRKLPWCRSYCDKTRRSFATLDTIKHSKMSVDFCGCCWPDFSWLRYMVCSQLFISPNTTVGTYHLHIGKTNNNKQVAVQTKLSFYCTLLPTLYYILKLSVKKYVITRLYAKTITFCRKDFQNMKVNKSYLTFFLRIKANSSSTLKATTLQRSHMRMESVFSLLSSRLQHQLVIQGNHY